MSSHEIEDVLSSIRRLVSEDLRPGLRGAAAAASGATGPAAAPEAGKLLLTPALRVVADASAAVPAPAVTDAVIPEPEAGVQAVIDATEPAESAAWPAPEAADVSDPVVEASPDPWPPEVAEGEVIWSAPGQADDPSSDDAMTEDLEPAVAARSAPHGHWTAQDLPGMDWVQEDSDWADPEPMPFVAHPRKAGLAQDPLARAWADKAEAEVRAELGETIVPPRAAAEAPPQPQPQAEPQSARATEGPGIFEGDDPEIDEEVLREIVRDIIREELAGTLGERITRNVRKLVRIEVNRALTAREFE